MPQGSIPPPSLLPPGPWDRLAPQPVPAPSRAPLKLEILTLGRTGSPWGLGAARIPLEASAQRSRWAENAHLEGP